MEKSISFTAKATEGAHNHAHSRRTIAASERILNGAILSADISRSSEEYFEILDYFHAEEIEATAESLNDPIQGKRALRARVAGFLVPLHLLTELAGISASIQWRPIIGDRPDETHSAWTIELRGATNATCMVTWSSRRRWRAGHVVSEHHYDHRRIGGTLTYSDLGFREGEMEGDGPTRLAKPQ